jgi:hypothetical protein
LQNDLDFWNNNFYQISREEVEKLVEEADKVMITFLQQQTQKARPFMDLFMKTVQLFGAVVVRSVTLIQGWNWTTHRTGVRQ